MKQATTLQTMATIYGHLGDKNAQKKKLEMALRFIRADDGKSSNSSIDSFRNVNSSAERERRVLEKLLQGELRVLQGDLLSKGDNWV